MLTGMPRAAPPRVFLLSPARLDGARARLLFHPVTMFPVARALRSAQGAPLGEVFSFLSGLYFRGKLAYAQAFARPPSTLTEGVFVVTTNRGLLPASMRVKLEDLERLAETDIHQASEAFRVPLHRDAEALARALGPRGEPVLLGSIASAKYADVLLRFRPAGPVPGGVCRSWRHEPRRAHAPVRGCQRRAHLRARPRRGSPRRPPAKAPAAPRFRDLSP
jgi:hypothetical protein